MLWEPAAPAIALPQCRVVAVPAEAAPTPVRRNSKRPRGPA